MNVKVKICGLTRPTDALAALEAGADYLGFILYERSPRHIAPEQLRELIVQLPQHAVKVGVFVNADFDFIVRTVDACRLDVVQLHGDEDAMFAGRLRDYGLRIWKALHLTQPEQFSGMEDFPAEALVIDSSTPQARGGTGLCCDWQLAAAAAKRWRVMLAGGINPGNAVTAAVQVQPYGLDVASGVESAPGIKDHQRIRQLMHNLQQAKMR